MGSCVGHHGVSLAKVRLQGIPIFHESHEKTLRIQSRYHSPVVRDIIVPQTPNRCAVASGGRTDFLERLFKWVGIPNLFLYSIYSSSFQTFVYARAGCVSRVVGACSHVCGSGFRRFFAGEFSFCCFSICSFSFSRFGLIS